MCVVHLHHFLWYFHDSYFASGNGRLPASSILAKSALWQANPQQNLPYARRTNIYSYGCSPWNVCIPLFSDSYSVLHVLPEPSRYQRIQEQPCPLLIVNSGNNLSKCLATAAYKWSRRGDYPCLCLCLGFSQITRMLPFLLIILHFSQIGFTDDLTFTAVPPFCMPSFGHFLDLLLYLLRKKHIAPKTSALYCNTHSLKNQGLFMFFPKFQSSINIPHAINTKKLHPLYHQGL